MRERQCLLPKLTPGLIISQCRGRKKLERDFALQPIIKSAVDLTHAARADRGADFISSHAVACRKRHMVVSAQFTQVEADWKR